MSYTLVSAATLLAVATASTASAEEGAGKVGVVVGLEPTLTHVRLGGFTDFTDSGSVEGSGNLFALQGTFLFDYGFSASHRLGLRLSAGRILNSDDSSGAAVQLAVGPAYTAQVGPVVLGLEGILQWYSFDDVSASVTGPRAIESSETELDGESMLAVAVAGRLGVRLPLTDGLELVPELRVQVSPYAFTQDGSSVFYESRDGTEVANDSTRFLAIGGSLLVGVRWTAL